MHVVGQFSSFPCFLTFLGYFLFKISSLFSAGFLFTVSLKSGKDSFLMCTFFDFFNHRNSFPSISNHSKLFFQEFIVMLDSVEVTFEVGIETCEFEIHTDILTVNKPIMCVSFLLAIDQIFRDQFIFHKNDFFRDSLVIGVVSFDVTRQHELRNKI